MQCHHGNTLGRCRLCELESQLHALAKERDALHAALSRLVAYGDADDRMAERWDGVTDAARAALAASKAG